MFRHSILITLATLSFVGVSAATQQPSPRKTPAPAKGTAPEGAQPQRGQTGNQAKSGKSGTEGKNPGNASRETRRRFVLDVVNSAVALPQPDPQDRLRVLNSAANIVASVRPSLAKQYAREGIRLEQELIQRGESPAVSLLESGHVDCASTPSFIENIPVEKIEMADQALVGAITSCQKTSMEPARRKIEEGLEKGHLAARPLLALMEQTGVRTPWSQEMFAKMFSNLPANVEAAQKEAPNYAAMYSRMATEVSKDAAKTAGIKFLVWLGKLKDSGEKNLALNIATDSMKQALGDEAYEKALESDVMARQAAQSAGQPGEIEHEEEESVSVLSAMGSTGVDRREELEGMAPSLRAREAAASGFATGTEGNKSMSAKYFDVAFAALNDVWENRSSVKDAPAVVEEVSEAAAHVDPVDALQRAQRLQDASAQAIGMIAVARVVAGGDLAGDAGGR